jgi:hypothetical protein
MTKPKPADAIMFSAVVLAENLGIPQREIAKAAMHVAVTIAEKNGDPDDYLGALVAASAKHLLKGHRHGR